MAKHAVLSPSSAKRWMTCPGSVALSEGIKEAPSTFADEGTAAHFLASECLIKGHDASMYVGHTILLLVDAEGEHSEAFEHVIGKNFYKKLNQFKVDDDMAGFVQVYLDYVRDVLKSTGGELFVEVRVPLDHITSEEGAEGTSDVVILADNEIIVIDLKYGRGVEVSAEENEQLLIYASGAMEKFSIMGDFDSVRVAISQPRISHQPSEWSCTAGALRAFEKKVKLAAAFVCTSRNGSFPEGTAEFNPSESACRWCKAKATCPALETKVQEDIGADFDDLLTSAPPKVGVYTNDLLAKKMACIDLIEDWCKAVRAKVESELLSGNEVEGYKLVQGRKGARAWTSADEAEALLKSMRLKIDQMYDFKLISPTTAEKVLADTPKRWSKVAALITQKEGGPSVAPVTDKRPAISVTPNADDFSALPAD